MSGTFAGGVQVITHHGTLLSPCLPWDLSGDLLVGVWEEWAPLPEAPMFP